VVFKLGERRFAFRLQAVLKVIHAVEFTPLTSSQHALLGAIRLSGEVWPLIDLSLAMGGVAQETHTYAPFLLAQHGEHKAALVVSDVSSVVSIYEDSELAIPDTMRAFGIRAAITVEQELCFIFDEVAFFDRLAFNES
jgi:chemotaxis signal transduction protein